MRVSLFESTANRKAKDGPRLPSDDGPFRAAVWYFAGRIAEIAALKSKWCY